MASKKRLIDANHFAMGVALYTAENAYLNDTALDVLKKVSDWLAEEPTVDAVKVVRCGKCKHYIPEHRVCQFWHGTRQPGHYCAEGERKDNG